MRLIIHLSKINNYIHICMYVCMYVCMYNFYLNKLFELLILLKEIIMIIKTHIKLILNMYNLFSKFYCRDRETTCDGEFKNTI